MNDLAQDEHWMMLALEQAQLGLGHTSPNPPVGAVIVAPNAQGKEEVIAASYHPKAGQYHAERRAILQAYEKGYGPTLKNATIYVTLEPCSSYGKTPPCTQAIIEAGIPRVVYACKDPDKRHQGRADALLSAAGCDVLSGLCQGPCSALIRPWVHAITHKSPWVVAKVATSLDARLSRAHTPRLSGELSQQYVHDLRAQSDAILVGGATVRCDNPRLTLRCSQLPHVEHKEQPWRVVVTRDAAALKQSAADYALFTDEFAHRTLLFEAVADWQGDLLQSLYRDYHVTQLMLECGGALLSHFLRAGLVDEWVQILTPYLVGGPLQLVEDGSYFPHEQEVVDTHLTPLGKDYILRGLIKS